VIHLPGSLSVITGKPCLHRVYNAFLEEQMFFVNLAAD